MSESLHMLPWISIKGVQTQDVLTNQEAAVLRLSWEGELIAPNPHWLIWE